MAYMSCPNTPGSNQASGYPQVQMQAMNMSTELSSNFAQVQSSLAIVLKRLDNIESKLAKLDGIEKQISAMNLTITGIDARVVTLETKMVSAADKLTDIERSRIFDSESVSELQQQQTDMQKQIKADRKHCETLRTDYEAMKRENTRLHEEILDLQSRTMRDNLVFINIPEKQTYDERKYEKCIDTITDFCQTSLKIEDANTIKIDRAHRMGKYNNGKTRPIVVKYNFFQDKQRVKQAASTELTNTNIRVKDQYPKEISERRTALYPTFKQAKDAGKNAVMSYDRLYIDGQTITIDNIPAQASVHSGETSN